ncbi:MAG: C69 family dipeptidase [Clostridia bacterium]|nr:C69 family dipeptidase [Clostridia bacterium]
MKHKLAVMSALALALCMLFNGALACTSIYVGTALTDDGSVIFGRSEDYGNSNNKLMYVAPAGKHTAGELYEGCYGFTWTFTHDSYGYTAFSDDNGEGAGNICPDCGSDHAHSPYEAGGTNEKGLTVSATESLGSSDAAYEADPYEDLGIEEAEIVTVLLSEAANAKEALDVLTGIYETAGACDGSGIFIADSAETWYIENVTGHQYIAVKLSDDMVMVQPNMSIIGAIDLDDTENVIASAGLIETAKAAGTFVGDEDANVINYVLSYNDETSPNARMVNALAYLDPAYADTEAEIDPAASYLISNIGENGEIVPMYTGITPAEKLTIADVQNFYHISNIGYVRNLETHVFQTYAEDGIADTIEWVTMNDAAINVFVPYYPMLTTDVDASYKLSTPTAPFVEEEPESGLYYATTATKRVDGERVNVEGYKILPENWADSMYWSFDALSNLVMYGGYSDEQVADVYAALYAKQDEVNAAFAEFKAGFDPAAEDAAEVATAWSMAVAQDVHQLAVDLTNGLIGE